MENDEKIAIDFDQLIGLIDDNVRPNELVKYIEFDKTAKFDGMYESRLAKWLLENGIVEYTQAHGRLVYSTHSHRHSLDLTKDELTKFIGDKISQTQNKNEVPDGLIVIFKQPTEVNHELTSSVTIHSDTEWTPEIVNVFSKIEEGDWLEIIRFVYNHNSDALERHLEINTIDGYLEDMYDKYDSTTWHTLPEFLNMLINQHSWANNCDFERDIYIAVSDNGVKTFKRFVPKSDTETPAISGSYFLSPAGLANLAVAFTQIEDNVWIRHNLQERVGKLNFVLGDK